MLLCDNGMGSSVEKTRAQQLSYKKHPRNDITNALFNSHPPNPKLTASPIVYEKTPTPNA